MSAVTLPFTSNPSELLLTFYKYLPFGVVLIDRQRKIVLTNQWILDHKGRQRRDWVGLDITEVLEPQSKEVVLSRLDETLQIGTTQTISFRFHPRVFQLYDYHGDLLPQSVMFFPAYVTDEIYGVFILIQDATERLISESDLKRQIQKLRTLNDIEMALRTLDYQTCLNTIVQRVKKHFDASIVALFLIDQNELRLVASEGWSVAENQTSLPLREGITGWVAEHAQPAFVNDVAQDKRYRALFPKIRSEIAVPLLVANECIGVLDLESEKPNAFTREDLEMLELIASSAAIAMHNARIHHEVERWQAYYRSVMDQTGDVIFTVDRQLRLVNANAAWDDFIRFFGREEWLSENAVGRSLLDVITGEERTRWQQICQALLEGHILTYREEIPWQERWFELKANPLIDSHRKIIGLIFSAHNITDYKNINYRLQMANQRLETLVDFTALLNQNLNFHTMLNQAVHRLSEIFRAELVVVITKLPGEEEYRPLAFSNSIFNPDEAHFTFDSLMEFIHENKTSGAIYWQQAPLSPLNQMLIAKDNLTAMLYTVLRYKDQILGFLQVYIKDEQRKFHEDEKSLLETLGIHLSMAMANALAYQEQQILAITDSLTGLYNRRKFLQMVTTEIERSRRFHRPLSILMIDLDRFKEYNDTYGHQKGDELLSGFALKLRKSLREYDTLARYGGDEFVLLLPETDVQIARKIAERQVATVRDMNVFITQKDGIPIYLTISIGVATFPTHAGDLQTLIKAADQALYLAKEAGRNCYMIYNKNKPLLA